MSRSSCLCGDTVWEAEGPFELMHHCHCSMCRKSHGAPFGTYLVAKADDFHWVKGESQRVRYASSPGFHRPFCARCGSLVPDGADAEGRVGLPAGCLDEDPESRPLAHIFVASKAPWYEISDDLPRFDAYPEGFGEGEVERPAPEPAAEGRVRGSCLCGGVVYELEGPLALIVNCHCSRCRKARSAAHGSNLATRAEQLHWIRGEQRVRLYEHPEAEFYANAFCETCGCPMPRVSEARGLALTPAGSLDHDPGARPRLHIHTGSKAPWFEIADDLPQFEEEPPVPG